METKHFKITMLGYTETGKTTYMAAMYAIMSAGMHGFTLSTQDPDEDLRLTDIWDALTDKEGKQRWPPPNNEDFHSFYFDFTYGYQNLIRFDWLDYRGGALKDLASKSDVQELTKRISESSCLFLCISGEHLKEKADASVTRKAQIKRMNLFIKQIAKEGKIIPIVIVITKYDFCLHRPQSDVLDELRQLFNPLFVKGANWPIMVCPVTLGKELAQDRNAGLIAPQHVHIPLIFAIYSEFAEEVRKKASKVQEAQQKLEWAKSRSWFAKVVDDLKGIDRSGKASNNLDIHEQELNEIVEKMKLLTRELKHPDTKMYFNGEEVEVDV